jgi:hypothetical protein
MVRTARPGGTVGRHAGEPNGLTIRLRTTARTGTAVGTGTIAGGSLVARFAARVP